MKGKGHNALGTVLGGAMAPFVALTSALRRARMFHPVGVLFGAEVTPATRGPGADLAQRLAGPALVRLSAALFRADHGPDVLGCAVRFGARDDVTPGPDQQDLLLATIRRPWTMLASPFATDVRDYLANRFYGVSPFVVETEAAQDPALAARPVEWRLRASARRALPDDGSLRGRARLRQEVATGEVALELAWAPYPGWWRLPDEAAFQPLVTITLMAEAELSQERLRFDPFRAGRGIHPVGLVHAARVAPYRASQLARRRAAR